MPWARSHPKGYECSSQGNRTYSALFARLADGRTLEEAYQLDVKGYRQVTNDWREAKGKPAANGKTRMELWTEYLGLWRTWAGENPTLITDLELKTRDLVLTDKFATSDVNQAHALSVIIDEIRLQSQLPFGF